MKALLFDEHVIQVFKVNDDLGEELTITWNRYNHTEGDHNSIAYIPEFIVKDSNGVELEEGCQDWLDAVRAAKAWE